MSPTELRGSPPATPARSEKRQFADPARLPDGSGTLVILASAAIHLAIMILAALSLIPLEQQRSSLSVLEFGVAAPAEPISYEILIQPTDVQTSSELMSRLEPIDFGTAISVPTRSDCSRYVRSFSHRFNDQTCRPLQATTRLKANHRRCSSGTRAYGNRFVYVIDMSGSMSARMVIEDSESETDDRKGTRLEIASAELMQSVSALTEDQSFYVILFNKGARKFLDLPHHKPEPYPCTLENKRLLEEWVTKIRPHGGDESIDRASARIATRSRRHLPPNGREISARWISDAKSPKKRHANPHHLDWSNPQ